MKTRSYRLELRLNNTQRVLCAKSAGTSRFAYNWMLSKLKERYEKAKQEANGGKVKCRIGSSIDWYKEFVILKNELPWIREVSKCCGQQALRNLEVAFKRFFSKKSDYPTFKKRGGKDSFRLEGQVFISSDYIQLPIFGKVRLKEKCYPILDGRVKLSQATVTRQADRWFVSFFIKENVENLKLEPIETIGSEDILGVDLGIKELAITSDGQTYSNPKAYKTHLKKLKKYQRRVSRKVKGSNNRKKAVTKLARINMRVTNVRTDVVQKLTTSLVKTRPKMIVIETLKPKNMSKNHKLASSILDSSFGKIKETLKYKCEWNGIHLMMAPTFYASSKYCSICGHKHKELKLSDREWNCGSCGTHHDRDVNAAKNLQFFGFWMIDKHLDVNPTTVSSTGSYACGDERLQFLTEQCSSMKQEFKSQNSTLSSFAENFLERTPK